MSAPGLLGTVQAPLREPRAVRCCSPRTRFVQTLRGWPQLAGGFLGTGEQNQEAACSSESRTFWQNPTAGREAGRSPRALQGASIPWP